MCCVCHQSVLKCLSSVCLVCCSKRRYLQHSRKEEVKEMQLFHGTSDETAVQAIFRQNFDPRVSGKNATMYGKGAYFATDSSFSDRFTNRSGHTNRWMFLARVLVGRYVKGDRDYSRPPPLDPAKPHGDLYDCCVDNDQRPSIYVIFESDQCYPEYVISYIRR